MAWTELTRRQHARAGGKYASDLTDAEWALIAPLMPPLKTTGRPRTTRLRDVFDAILYMATTGCQWWMSKLRDALKAIGRWTVQVVKRSDTTKGFEVLPRRWVVERTLAWLGRCRRLSKDWEKSIASAEAWVTIAHIRRVTRHLART